MSLDPLLDPEEGDGRVVGVSLPLHVDHLRRERHGGYGVEMYAASRGLQI